MWVAYPWFLYFLGDAMIGFLLMAVVIAAIVIGTAIEACNDKAKHNRRNGN